MGPLKKRAPGFPQFVGILGPLVKKNRERKGLSLAEAAPLLGFTANPRPQGKDGKHRGPEVGGYQNFEGGGSDGRVSQLLRACEVYGPDFADEMYDIMFRIAIEGLKHERDKELLKAVEARDEHLDKAAEIGQEIQNRRRKPKMPGAA